MLKVNLKRSSLLGDLERFPLDMAVNLKRSRPYWATGKGRPRIIGRPYVVSSNFPIPPWYMAFYDV